MIQFITINIRNILGLQTPENLTYLFCHFIVMFWPFLLRLTLGNFGMIQSITTDIKNILGN